MDVRWAGAGGGSTLVRGGQVVASVAVIEDDPRYRRSLTALLQHSPGLALAGAYGLLADALAAAHTSVRAWDLVLTDLELPDGSGLDVIRALKAERPALPIVVITVFESPRTLLEAICAGADGYLLKRSSASELLDAIHAVLGGGSPLTPAVARGVLELVRAGGSSLGPVRPTRLNLTDREQAVLRHLAGGASYKQVGAELDLSIDTVRTYIRTLYRKLQVHSVAEAVSKALREGLV